MHAFGGHRGFGGQGAALGGLFGTGVGGPGAGMFGGFGAHMNAPAPPSAFNHPYRAYSSAIHEIQQGRGNAGANVIDGGRAQVMFGGQSEPFSPVLSTLYSLLTLHVASFQSLCQHQLCANFVSADTPEQARGKLADDPTKNTDALDLESPWTFELINPLNPQLRTHAGVLEFTADEGVVYLPRWMMKRLNLNEGDGIRLYGTRLPKGKFVKLQPQSVTFLELSDPKAVLEQAMRAYTVISPGDIIEIHYNMMTFELLVMEVQPDAAGISVLNTDLEVDFAPPVGYVEPERKPAAPAPTMQSKLNINIAETQDVDARGSGASTPALKPGSSAPGGVAGPAEVSKPQPYEAFKGIGFSLAGKRVKGKGINAKPIQPLEEGSKIWKTSNVPKIVTVDTQIGARQVPAALNLPEGTLFFGYKFKPPKSENEKEEKDKPKQPTFSGVGSTLSGRRPSSKATSSKTSSSKKDPSIDAIEIDSD